MRKVVVLASLVVLVLVGGCASLNPSYGIISFGQTDTSTKSTLEGEAKSETMVIVPIGASLFSNDDKMGLKIGRYTKSGKDPVYFFKAEVHSSGWLFIRDIRIKIDDATFDLHDESPKRTVQSGHYVREELYFVILPEMLENLRSANSFSAELYKRVVSLDPGQLQQMKAFLQ